MLATFLSRFKTWFVALKNWQKVLFVIVAFSVVTAPFQSPNTQENTSQPTQTPTVSASQTPVVGASQTPVVVASPTPKPLLFTAPAWMDVATAQAYSSAFSVIEAKTNMGLDRIISVEFIDFDDGTYGTFIQIAADENFSMNSACGSASTTSQKLFVEIMNNVPYDFGKYELFNLQILARGQGTDDYGNAAWFTIHNTQLERTDFTKINWKQTDIRYLVDWDDLGGVLSCDESYP